MLLSSQPRWRSEYILHEQSDAIQFARETDLHYFLKVVELVCSFSLPGTDRPKTHFVTLLRL
jgi:hypothetical protein